MITSRCGETRKVPAQAELRPICQVKQLIHGVTSERKTICKSDIYVASVTHDLEAPERSLIWVFRVSSWAS